MEKIERFLAMSAPFFFFAGLIVIVALVRLATYRRSPGYWLAVALVVVGLFFIMCLAARFWLA